MADRSSQQIQQWNPESAFSAANPDKQGDFTCMSQMQNGWRYRNPIAKRNQDAALEILNQLSRMDPLDVASTEDWTGKLHNLEEYALCHRYHQC